MKKIILRVIVLCCAVLLGACMTTFQPQTYLNGTISQEENINYPKDSLHLQVQLLELNNERQIVGVIAEQYINKPATIPIQFSLCYDKNTLKKDAIYAINVRLFADGELVMQSFDPEIIDLSKSSDNSPRIELKKLLR